MNLGHRSLRLVLFAAAVGALGFGAYVAKTGVAHKLDAQRAAALARDRARDTGQSLVYAQQRDKWVSGATQVVAESKQTGMSPEQWVERKVNYRAISTTRAEADRLVRDTAASQSRLFVAEQFELSVLSANEGLFDIPSAEDRGVVLTLAGSYFASDVQQVPVLQPASLPPQALIATSALPSKLVNTVGAAVSLKK